MKFGKAADEVFGDELAEVDKIIRPLITTEHALAQCIGGLTARRDKETASRVVATHREACAIRTNQYDNQLQINTGITALSQGINQLGSKLDLITDDSREGLNKALPEFKQDLG